MRISFFKNENLGGYHMSYVSSQAKLHTASKKLGHKCKAVHRDYTNFAGTTVPPLTKEQYKNGMKRYIEKRT